MSKRIPGKFSPRLIEMLESSAYRALSRAAHQVLARIEIEHANHGGKDNGSLPVTFDQFVAYGIHRRMIAPAIRELVALGFLEITQQGRAGNGEWRRPNMFRLTYRDTDVSATNEWRRITEDDVAMAAKGARRRGSRQRSKKARPEKQNTSGTKCTNTSGTKCTTTSKKPNKSIVHKVPLLLDIYPSTGEAQASKQRQPQPSPADANGNSGELMPDPGDVIDLPDFLPHRATAKRQLQ